MGMTGVFKWFKRDMTPRDRSRRSLPSKLSGLNNDAYRSAFQAFLDRRRDPADPGFIINSPEKGCTENTSILWKKNYENTAKNIDESELSSELVTICEIPYASPSEILEIGWVAGTEDRNIELLYAEWNGIKVSLRKHLKAECKNAIKADIKILSEVRHPNIMLLMGTTHTSNYSITAICEPIDCTLYHYLHEQFQQISIQDIAKKSGQLTAALKFAHMRGYVHTAINSYSVFLTSNGVIKLGGWELAVNVNKIAVDARKYENCLRSEIFRWQAPELFSRQKPTTATDIYGLALLMWEMATMNIPWADLNKEELEQQYLQLKRGLMTSTYNFPPLLNNLLKNGLQLDVSKRTLNTTKMTRYLQKLEMQYGEKNPLYVDQSFTTIQDSLDDFSFLSETSMIASSVSLNVLQSVSATSFENPPAIANYKTSDSQKMYFTQQKTSEIEEKISAAVQRKTPIVYKKTPMAKDRTANQIQQKTPVYKNLLAEQTTPKSKKKIESRKLFHNYESLNESIQDRTFNSTSTQSIDCNDSYGEIYTHESRQSPVLMRRPPFNLTIDDSIPEESVEEPRLDRKKLKEVIANRRSTFFTTNVPQVESSDPFQKYQDAKAKIISQGASKDYEPYKPASHKTSIEPKMNSSAEYSILSSASPKKIPRSPYSYVPAPIRSAVTKPQVLNSSSQSFFESSHWSEEKSLCTSRTQFYDSLKAENKKSSPSSNKTFTVESSPDIDASNDHGNPELKANEKGVVATISTIPRYSPLKALRDTLDRVTDLVKSSAHVNNLSSQSLSPNNLKDFKNYGEADGSLYTPETIFEELYKLNDNVEEEIRPIERSDSAGTFTVEVQKFFNISDDGSPKNQQDSPTLVEVQTALQFGIPICNRNEHSEFIKDEKSESRRLNGSTEKNINYEDKNNFELFGDHLEKNSEYTSYSEITLSRRRSLPPASCQLKNNGNSNGKTESLLARENAKKIDVITDGTVEDFYIDDEFTENSLAPNMLLSDRNSTTDNISSDDIHSHSMDQSRLI